MAELKCERLHEIGPELALGVLAGRDRAEAIEHLQDCPACEQHVRELSVVGDRLVLLVPGAEPPVGFEQRVLERLGLAQRRRWRHRRWLAAAAVVLAIGLAAGGWALRGVLHDTESQPFITANLTSTGGPVGEVSIFTDRRAWLYVDLSTATSPTVTCQLLLTDGRSVDVGTFPTTGAETDWASPVSVAGTQISDVRIIAEDGSLIGTAHFG
jgi:hypothetical protein